MKPLRFSLRRMLLWVVIAAIMLGALRGLGPVARWSYCLRKNREWQVAAKMVRDRIGTRWEMKQDDLLLQECRRYAADFARDAKRSQPSLVDFGCLTFAIVMPLWLMARAAGMRFRVRRSRRSSSGNPRSLSQGSEPDRTS